ncbi:MAG: 50S ribosomal protein L30e [Desulfurococcales archaeon ex4484_42]|nr:MAG: 50S ribosomal protein L30e [Desulfurococcales archaeon ex4484_42]
MTYEKETLSLENEIKTLLKTGKVIIGARKSIKALKLGKAKAVIIASLIPKYIEEDVKYYAKLGGIKIIRYKGSSYELGTLCGKPFPITTIAVLDPGESRILEVEG